MENFIPLVKDDTNEEDLIHVILFRKTQVLTAKEDGMFQIPAIAKDETYNLGCLNVIYLGKLNRVSCYAARNDECSDSMYGYQFCEIKQTYCQEDDRSFWLIGYALHLLNWESKYKYCSNCKGLLRNSLTDRAKKCEECGAVFYPNVTPAIIVGVIKENKILLARNKGYNSGFYSLIAGFVEPGEMLERCVEREVKEEVGLNIKNIKYFGSQPWPFPDSLMIAFTAEYASGDIAVDGEEIEEAAWFSADNMPSVPGKHSIARQLIDWYCSNYQ